MIEKELANDILMVAMATGGSFAEIFIENNKKSNVSLINGKVERAMSGTDFGLGLRIFDKDRVIYSYTNDLEKDKLIKMAKDAATAIISNEYKKIEEIKFEKLNYENIHKIKIMPDSIEKRKIVEMLRVASNAAKEYDELITQTSSGFLYNIQDVTIINSEGLYAEDRRIRTRATISAIASNQNEKQSGYFGPGALKGMEFYDEINMEDYAREAARSAVVSLKADLCPSGKMPVILDNGFGGVIFHEACGHGLEASAIAKGASVFAGKIGEQIASEKVTAIDDGTIKNSWGSINIDDEGKKGRKNILIENGILKNYMVDRFNGNKMGMSATGSSRRQSYRYVPTSRMTNTYIAAGTDKKEDIIKNTEYGLYAKYMGGGSVNPATGEFNFAVNEAYIIKNGKICEPVRGATLIGKGNEILKKIDMVSDNLKLAEGMCGASSGSIPVDVGQPMLRVEEITVGGRK